MQISSPSETMALLHALPVHSRPVRAEIGQQEAALHRLERAVVARRPLVLQDDVVVGAGRR